MENTEFQVDWKSRCEQAEKAFMDLMNQVTELTRISEIPMSAMEQKDLRVTAHAKSEALIPPTCPGVNRLFEELPATPTLSDLNTLRTRIKTEATVPLRQALIETCERELILLRRVHELEEALTYQKPKVYLVRRKDTGEYYRGDKVRHSVVQRTAWTPHAERAKIYWQQDQVARFFEGAYYNPPEYEIVTFNLVEST